MFEKWCLHSDMHVKHNTSRRSDTVFRKTESYSGQLKDAKRKLKHWFWYESLFLISSQQQRSDRRTAEHDGIKDNHRKDDGWMSKEKSPDKRKSVKRCGIKHKNPPVDSSEGENLTIRAAVRSSYSENKGWKIGVRCLQMNEWRAWSKSSGSSLINIKPVLHMNLLTSSQMLRLSLWMEKVKLKIITVMFPSRRSHSWWDCT